jgi:hypothetical protein
MRKRLILRGVSIEQNYLRESTTQVLSPAREVDSPLSKGENSTDSFSVNDPDLKVGCSALPSRSSELAQVLLELFVEGVERLHLNHQVPQNDDVGVIVSLSSLGIDVGNRVY